ncbi:hypothetical protein E2C01_004231 [Portunus trituberculatus]|uniref:Uncharacterized protein n=1 Tax=Portunus trituberculatus TaxID=210409 RepID=A0A5B7CPD7_PORTR|nr:hypothetical protein [Portunus trituberculatus]
MNVDIGVEGVWAMRANNPPANPHSGPSAPKNAPPFPPMPHPPITHPPPPYLFCHMEQGDKDPQVHVREVTMEALQQVMSAGGQQVRVTGQRLEVVSVEKPEESQTESAVKEIVLAGEHTLSTSQAEEEINGTSATAEGELSKIPTEAKEFSAPPPAPPSQTEVESTLQVEPLNPVPTSQEPNGEVPQTLVYPVDPSIAFISPPPPPHIPPPQVYSPVPPADGSCTPSEYNTPPPQPLPPPPTTSTSTATTMPARPEPWDPNVQDSEAMKMNPGVPPYMVYHMPMMYGGFGGYSYNPHWGCSIPVMPSPATIEEGKQTPLMPDGGCWRLGTGICGQCSAHPLQRKVTLLCCESLPPYLIHLSLFNLMGEMEGKMGHPSTITTTTITIITHGAGAVVGHITEEGDTIFLHTNTQIIMATTSMVS